MDDVIGEEPTVRNYARAQIAVSNNYLKARKTQTLAYVLHMKQTFSLLNTKMDIWDILYDLNSLIDVSDPDCSFPNLYHAIQTAEMIRKDGHPEWMQLIGLLHDIGKIMYKRGNDAEGTGVKEQWAMVGDTFIVGSKLPDSLIYPEFNTHNPDRTNASYNTTLGIYKPNCGLDTVHCSWGHDEYLYSILTSPKNPNQLPEEALYIIRFHSLYAYHDMGAYMHFQNDKDKRLLSILKTFNKYDLYSKHDDIINIESVKEYYTNLINKFFSNSFLYI